MFTGGASDKHVLKGSYRNLEYSKKKLDQFFECSNKGIGMSIYLDIFPKKMRAQIPSARAWSMGNEIPSLKVNKKDLEAL